MNLDRVTPGNNIPNEINVIIEIPAHSDPVKYEVDKETGAMFVDRFMNTAMHYPLQLRLRATHPVRGRRPGGRAGDYPDTADYRLRDLLPAHQHDEDDG